MDHLQGAGSGGAQGVRGGLAVLVLALFSSSYSFATESWVDQVRRQEVGPFPMIRPFVGEFRFGWSGIEVAAARAEFSREGPALIVEVAGGTTGLARTLWQLGATHRAVILARGLKPVGFHQVETYATRTTTTEAVFKQDGLWYRRAVQPGPAETAWRRLKAEPVRDIVSALLFIRSHPLQEGDRVAVAAFPGNAPYFLEAAVKSRESIRVAGRAAKAIRLEFSIQRIDERNPGRLLPYTKFQRGTVWLSDDADRIPLRAEVDIFLGKVYGELKSFSPGGRD